MTVHPRTDLSVRDQYAGTRPGTIGIYLVMWWDGDNGRSQILAAYDNHQRALDHAAPFAHGRGLRTGDSVWVAEQVLHIGVREQDS